MKSCIFAAWLCSASVFASAQDGRDALDAAKSLYLAASYQEALTALEGINGGEAVDEAAKYRALCFLGLNRPEEAQQAIEHLIERRPLYTLDALDSPKLRAMFNDARARVLPVAATNLYQAAKAAFDKGELGSAGDQFATVVKLLGEPEVASQPSVADLKVLATGFAKLVDQELAMQRQAAAVAPKQTAAATPPPAAPKAPATPGGATPTAAPPPLQTEERIYSERDTDVVPPVPLAQTIPPWVPPTMAVRSVTFNGVLDVIVDETGTVTSVTITRPTIATYDQLLVAAAKAWRYRPASYQGRPVKYRKTVRVTLRPQPASPNAGQPPSIE
jgi:TonB family protein